jgi:uncharacterized protein YjiS (DUF1127 family)
MLAAERTNPMTFASRAFHSVWSAARGAAAWPFRVAAARATLRALASMDRRELADIGLNASDVRDVSALPLDHDPTLFLARRSYERRRHGFGPPQSAEGGRWPTDDAGGRPGRGRPPSRPAPNPAAETLELVRTG